MDTQLKQKIKLEVQNIVDEIEYEEYQFNKIFHSNIEFQKSYYKFQKIYDKYGKKAYLKYVPYKYKKQELKSLINEKKFIEIYKHYGVTTLKKLEYSANLTNKEFNTQNKFKLFFIKIKKLISCKFISLPAQTMLALPAGISDFNGNLNNDVNINNDNNNNNNNNNNTNNNNSNNLNNSLDNNFNYSNSKIEE